MNSSSHPHTLSFCQWQERQERLRKRQGNYVWAASLGFSSLCFLAMIGIFYSHPHHSTVLPIQETEQAIALDLSSEMIPPSPAATAIPEPVEPLPETQSDIPPVPESAEHATLPVLPKIEPIKKMEKPVTPHKPHPVPHQKIQQPTPEQTVNNSADRQSSVSSSQNSQNSTGNPAKSVSPANWYGQINAKLEKMKHYPAEAQSEEQEGTAIVHIVLDRQGHVLTSSLLKSSGHALLDKEAIALSHRVDPFPAPPDNIKGSVLKLNIPIQFSLPKD